jgi:hypothetical protein
MDMGMAHRMIRRLGVVVTLLGLLVAVSAACGGGPAANVPATESPTSASTAQASDAPIQGLASQAPWADGERLRYHADRQGQAMGTAEFSIAKEAFGWTISEVDAFAPVTQTIVMRLTPSLRPLGETSSAVGPQNNTTLNTSYRDTKLAVSSTVNGESKQSSLVVPMASLDIDQLLMTLRALAFATGLQTKLTVIDAGSLSQIPLTVQVQSRETISTPLGSFETWKTVLDFGQAKQYCWYQVDSPHLLVKFDDGSFTLLLAEKQT